MIFQGRGPCLAGECCKKETLLEKMKNWYWLKNVGSPRSRILIKCEIKNIQKQVERGIVGAHFFFLQRNSKVPTQYKLTL